MHMPVLIRIRWVVVAGLLVLAAGYRLLQPVPFSKGVQAPHQPEQTILEGGAVIERGGFRLMPVASFKVEGRVLGVKRYRSDPTAVFSPYDLAVGWGSMSDVSVIEKLDVRLGKRAYRWTSGAHTLNTRDVILHSTNMHIIPANAVVENALGRIKPGHIIRLTGRLVHVLASDGGRWRTSLTRADVGMGACEIVYTDSLTIRGR